MFLGMQKIWAGWGELPSLAEVILTTQWFKNPFLGLLGGSEG